MEVDPPASGKRFIAVLVVVAATFVSLPSLMLAVVDAATSPVTHPTPWHLVELDANGLGLVIDVTNWPGCEPLHGVTVSESRSEVLIETTVKTRPSLEMCPEKPDRERTRVLLEHPLGNRMLTGCGDNRASDPLVADEPPLNGFCAQVR